MEWVILALSLALIFAVALAAYSLSTPKRKHIGTINVVRTTGEDPYVFIELDKSLDDLYLKSSGYVEIKNVKF